MLIVANPCFGLDFAAVAEIRAADHGARNRGAAVLLVSEDLDEILELADRIVVIFDGRLVYEARASDADRLDIGRHMAGMPRRLRLLLRPLPPCLSRSAHAVSLPQLAPACARLEAGGGPSRAALCFETHAAQPCLWRWMCVVAAMLLSMRAERERSCCRAVTPSHHGLVPLQADAQHLVGIALPPVLRRRKSRPRCGRDSRSPPPWRGCARRSMTPSPIMPRSSSRSVVGTSQSQT